MQLYQYAIWKDEKRDADDNVVEEATLLVEPKVMLAASEKHVGIVASRQIGEEHDKDLDRINVIIRPF